MSDLVSIFSPQAIERLRKAERIDPEQVRRLRNALFKKFQSDEDALQAFSAADRIRCHELAEFQKCDSELDGATKFLFRTSDGLLIESVILRIATGRNTLCVSSQVGCAAACDFCATGKMGIAHNLSTAQILDQVVQCGQHLAREGRRLNNIVFMGMGEPFHNEEALHETVSQLRSPQLFDRPASGILVSTVGVPEAMVRFAESFPDCNLALSLHSARQEVREQIIPLAKKHPLDEIRQTLNVVSRIQQREVMIEYLMLQGVNDSIADAHELLRFMDGLQVHINLIPYNPIEDSPHLAGSDRATIDVFSKVLKDAGQKTTVRYSLGKDIAAACGQLVRRENRAIARSNKHISK